jgi:hypothetical protein
MALHDPDDAPKQSSDKLKEVHKRALRRFDSVAMPQQEIRAHALLCRRFISIPGAMWEGPWGDQFENSIKVEIDKLSKGVDKIVQDYRANRIVPDFRPSGGNSDQDTADTLDGLHRADSYHFKAQQARDNAFEEAAAGGFGAYRLANDYADPDDKDCDEQRVNPGLLIADADQRVFFDGNSKLYDKSDAKWAFVLTADSREAFEEEYPGKAVDWPESKKNMAYDWFAPDVVVKAEYYEVIERDEKLLVFTQLLTESEERWWEDELDAKEIAELKARGWKMSTKMRRRKRVQKYTMTGAEVLEDHGLIAGPNIPIVPVYGKRWFVDNQERFRGHVSKLMDAQRNLQCDGVEAGRDQRLAPREKPIFLAEQCRRASGLVGGRRSSRILTRWSIRSSIRTASMSRWGRSGRSSRRSSQPVTAPCCRSQPATSRQRPTTAPMRSRPIPPPRRWTLPRPALMQKSAIYLDNMKQSVQREGEIYLGMAPECYFEDGRIVETMSEDGDDGEATLKESFTDSQGVHRVRNDFSSGRYKVIADVTEATATRRDKTVKSMLATAQIAMEAGDQELAQASILTAVMNQDGEGSASIQKYARKKLVVMGIEEPNEAEKAEMEQAQQQPDPTQQLAAAKRPHLKPHRRRRRKPTGCSQWRAPCSRWRRPRHWWPGTGSRCPRWAGGRAQGRDINKDAAEADHMETQTAHCPRQLAIEGHNAETNRMKALADRAKRFLRGG